MSSIVNFNFAQFKNKVVSITKKTDLKRKQQEQFPEGKFPWGEWDYTSSSQDSGSSTEVSDLTNVEDETVLSTDDFDLLNYYTIKLYIYRNDGQYKVCGKYYNKTKIQFEFPVVKRKQKLRAQNAEKAAEADDESND